MRVPIFVRIYAISTHSSHSPGPFSPVDEPVLPDDLDILGRAIQRAQRRSQVLVSLTGIGVRLAETVSRRAVAWESGRNRILR